MGAAWRFRSRPVDGTSREETLRFRVALDAALRAAHGRGLNLSLLALAGRPSALWLGSDSSDGERWIERALAEAYAPGQWQRVERPRLPSSALVLEGRRPRLPGETVGPDPEPGIALRTLLLGFVTGSQPVSLQVRASPICSRPPRAGWLHRPPGACLDRSPVGSSRLPSRATENRSAPAGVSPPVWSVCVSLHFPSPPGAPERRRAIGAAEAACRTLDGTGIRFRPRPPWAFGPAVCVLSLAELAALLPPRDLGVAASASTGEATSTLALGRGRDGAVLGLPLEPGQGRHLAILGETGMGKSSLLVSLAARATRNAGVVLLDPIGDTARAVAAELTPRHREFLWVSPGPAPPSLNALDGIGPTLRSDPVGAERRIRDLVHALRRVRAGRYVESTFWGPRLEEMLTRAIRAACVFPGGTLEDAHSLLSTRGYTRRLAPTGGEEILRESLERIRERPEDADGARRLLYEVVRDPTLSEMLCARRPSLQPGDLVRPHRVVLVSGEAARVGEASARYLLAVTLALIWAELLSSPPCSKTFVVLDEAQWFAHESLTEMLRLSRRRNVHVVLATQSARSLPDDVQDALWANVADLVAFRGAPEEARELCRIVPGISPDRLLALDRGEAALFLGKGRALHWVRTARSLRATDRTSSVSATAAPPPTSSDPHPSAAEPALVPLQPMVGTAPAAPSPANREPNSVWAWLVDRAIAAPAGTPFPVSLADLRRTFPEDEPSVRRAGALLGRAGALVKRNQTDGGTIWWLDPARVREMGSASQAPLDGPTGERSDTPPTPRD